MTGGGCCGQEGEGDSHTACTRVTQCYMGGRCVVSVCGECAVGMSAMYSGREWRGQHSGCAPCRQHIDVE